ncbi:SusF/SusE family outer membrane protein [Winogradskyella wichelsiae]|uniref:SusF/SusE family outer membrane protein n=1 Tax=Winogradskyella wichelsiae TaxID=2697007 RepID=UPI0015CC8ED0|nr:SusF/SusE family outer membrane protein [Winogradskyella wichelsiae]
MKTIKYLALLLITVISFNACESDDSITYIAQPTGDLTFTNAFLEEYILIPSASSNIGERFTWSDADFDIQTNINYELQKSIIGDFTDTEVIGTTGDNSYAVTIGDLLGYAEEAGLDSDDATEMPDTGNVYFRVRAILGTDAALEIISPIQALVLVLPGVNEVEVPELPKLYVVGSFLEASGYGSNWTASDAVPIAASEVGDNNYEGFVYMNMDTTEFKFLPTNESFDGDYGDDGTFSGVLLQEGESNCSITGSGYYYVKANLDDLTYTTEATSWGIIGNATPGGWDSDTDMTYDQDSKTWSVIIELTSQEAPDNGLKFRANDDWALNIGDTDADGTMEFDGQNIGIDEAGTYLITLDLSNARQYTYSIELQ